MVSGCKAGGEKLGTGEKDDVGGRESDGGVMIGTGERDDVGERDGRVQVCVCFERTLAMVKL